MKSILTKNQKKIYGPRFFTEGGHKYSITAKVRYDDECGNGHNTFSITGEIWKEPRNRQRDCESFGCLHNEIAKHFPELAPFIKWHLTSSDGPLHYIANTLFHAGDKDHNGLRKGEFKQIKDRKTGLPVWRLNIPYEVAHEFIDSETKPEPKTFEYEPVGHKGEGKNRELDFARSSAVWPEATDEELCSDNLEQMLIDRHPMLMDEFRKAVVSLGFVY